MRAIVLSICIGVFILNANSQSKLVGAGKADKVGVSTATPAKSPTLPKPPPSKQ